MKNYVTIDFSVDVACTNAHLVAGILLESEVLETRPFKTGAHALN